LFGGVVTALSVTSLAIFFLKTEYQF